MFLKDIEVLCKYVPNYSSDCKMYIEQYGALVFEVIAGLIVSLLDLRGCRIRPAKANTIIGQRVHSTKTMDAFVATVTIKQSKGIPDFLVQ